MNFFVFFLKSQTSVILNFENNRSLKSSASMILSKLLSPLYNTDHVIKMKPISEEVRNELKFRLNGSDRLDKSSEKTKSYNIFNNGNQMDTIIKPNNNKNRGIISKIYQSSKTNKFHLFKYDAVKGETSDIILDGFFSNRSPLKKCAMGKNLRIEFA